ncbi:toxin-antitoxin system HicB family antitoxin [Methylocaldum sp. MU1018]
MSALIIRLPKERLKQVAQVRNVSVNRLIDEMVTLVIADFDAETRFRLRAARGIGKEERGRELLAKAIRTEN